MTLVQKLSQDLKVALRAKESLRVGLIRMLLASTHNREIEKQGRGERRELTDEETIQVLRKEAKKCKEAWEIYSRAGRNDLALKERQELALIEGYLPKSLAPSEVEAIVSKVIQGGATDFGQVMKAAMAEVKGRAEAKLVSEIVKRSLGQ